MKRLPRISVITPSYNQAAYIEQTIQSVLSQDYPDLEYIVMDGGSTDGTLEILKKYNGRLTWISERDRGQSHAINKGFQMATGEVLAFLNSDDLYEPGALIKVGQFFAENPKSVWLTGRCHIIDQDGAEMRKLITQYKNFWLRLQSYRVLLVINYISQPATFWRREAMQCIGEFDESLCYALDYDYSLRVGSRYLLWILPEYLASFRVHQTSKGVRAYEAYFSEDYSTACRFTSSSSLLFLHRLHNALIVSIYRKLVRSQAALA